MASRGPSSSNRRKVRCTRAIFPSKANVAKATLLNRFPESLRRKRFEQPTQPSPAAKRPAAGGVLRPMAEHFKTNWSQRFSSDCEKLAEEWRTAQVFSLMPSRGEAAKGIGPSLRSG